jgi:uncharacterized protein (DUF433 family)
MTSTDVAVKKYIEQHPRKRDPAEARLVQSGTPIWSLIGYLIGVDWDRERTARDYDIPREAVDAAIAYYHEHEADLTPRIRRTLINHTL